MTYNQAAQEKEKLDSLWEEFPNKHLLMEDSTIPFNANFIRCANYPLHTPVIMPDRVAFVPLSIMAMNPSYLDQMPSEDLDCKDQSIWSVVSYYEDYSSW